MTLHPTGAADCLFVRDWVYVCEHVSEGVVELAALVPEDCQFVFPGLTFEGGSPGNAEGGIPGGLGHSITTVRQALSAATRLILHAAGPSGLPEDAPVPLDFPPSVWMPCLLPPALTIKHRSQDRRAVPRSRVHSHAERGGGPG